MIFVDTVELYRAEITRSNYPNHHNS